MLNDVSETALITLKARVIEAKKENPLLRDDTGVNLLNRIESILPIETRKRIIDRKLPSTLTRHIALRARKYDSYARNFIKENTDGLVVSLGCGFDTRYWRVSEKPWKYIEIDLPGVIAAKNEILKDNVNYSMVGCSVLEEKWIKEISAIQNENVLFLAEGLFMYLPQNAVEGIFKKISETFSKSSIVFEVVNKKYTKGIWKKVVEARMKRALGSEAGSYYEFGVYDAKEIESYGKSIRVFEEWSYFEDKDIRPKFLRLLRNIKFMSRTQWTIKAIIGQQNAAGL
ncbi:class I SAM-dependent methyltransferase [candidate division KSB1 bacterium]